jgi:hypothetical protein
LYILFDIDPTGMSRRRRTKKKHQNRKPKPVVEDTRWYTIRCIVDERTSCEELEYLVDWEDDIETGESYGPTWVKGCDVTEAAKKEWECTKESKQSEKPIAAPHPQLNNVNNDDGNDNNQPPGATRPRSKRSRPITRKTGEG